MFYTIEEIEALHRKYAQTKADFELVYRHCQVIEAIAIQLLDAKPIPGIDRQLVRVGCLLHDIGAYRVLESGSFVKGVRHGVLGEAILKDEGFPEEIYRFASHHTGVELTKQDVIDQKLPIPVADYLAETDEELLIMYADKFHSKSSPPKEPPYFCSFDWYRKSVQQFGEDKAEKFERMAQRFGIPDLEQLSKKYGYKIRD